MSDELLQRLGVDIEPQLLQIALTHSSFSYENGGEDYERLEFLGDSILGYLAASAIFESNPSLSEGELTKLKNGIVSARALATVASRLDIGPHIRLGKGEQRTRGGSKENILADVFEALLGAAYLTGGLASARTIVELHVLPLLQDADQAKEFTDPKTTLAVKLAKAGRGEPVYQLSEAGPEHDRQYSAVCFCDGRQLGSGQGTTKRRAETEAARSALRSLMEG